MKTLVPIKIGGNLYPAGTTVFCKGIRGAFYRHCTFPDGNTATLKAGSEVSEEGVYDPGEYIPAD